MSEKPTLCGHMIYGPQNLHGKCWHKAVGAADGLPHCNVHDPNRPDKVKRREAARLRWEKRCAPDPRNAEIAALKEQLAESERISNERGEANEGWQKELEAANARADKDAKSYRATLESYDEVNDNLRQLIGDYVESLDVEDNDAAERMALHALRREWAGVATESRLKARADAAEAALVAADAMKTALRAWAELAEAALASEKQARETAEKERDEWLAAHNRAVKAFNDTNAEKDDWKRTALKAEAESARLREVLAAARVVAKEIALTGDSTVNRIRGSALLSDLDAALRPRGEGKP